MSHHEYPHAWWKEAVVYQIYPISFSDSNGDGLGDLNGIYAKLEYLKDLGVDVLWLSPIYPSPLADMGYDISDYRGIDPRYGTLEDWDRLLEGVHERGMKLMMDLVVNHTSDEHEWFIESRSSKSNPKRDWYIWRPPKYDFEGNRQPPSNWKSVFEGSAWEYDAATDEYYLHLYLDKQPDLNWDNREVREAVWSLMKFWLDRGCDGFRMDVINLISKVDGHPDVPVSDPKQKYQIASQMYVNGPKCHEYIQEMNRRVLSKYDLITVGEAPFTHDSKDLAEFVLPANKELNMVFSFEVVEIDNSDKGFSAGANPLQYREWKLSELKDIIKKWQTLLREEGFWNAVFIENHDQARSVSRYANDSPEYRARSAKLLAMMQTTLSGTLYVYQGEEIGMKNFPASWPIGEYKDVATQNYHKRVLQERKAEAGEKEVDMSDVLYGCQRKARDHARTPVQWNDKPHGGFTTGTPWMRVNDDYTEWNVSAQLEDPDSVLAFWKRALATRKQNDVLVHGNFCLLSPHNEKVFAYTRALGNTTTLVLLNFSDEETIFSLAEVPEMVGSHLLLGNYAAEKDVDTASEDVKLAAYAAQFPKESTARRHRCAFPLPLICTPASGGPSSIQWTQQVEGIVGAVVAHESTTVYNPMDPISSVIEALKRESLIPEVIPETFQPSLLFSVIYPTGKEVMLGNELTVADTADEPEIVLTPMNVAVEQADSTGDAKGDLSYTLVMLDPDAPTRKEPIYRQFRHWVITGLKAPLEGDLKTANVVALHTHPSTTPYRPPGPRSASGLHRYTFLLFQEPSSEQGFTIPRDAPEHGVALEERRKWNAVQFGERHGLKLIGANFFLVRAGS
ncbi:hypothetical protein EW146_g4401 [Bondarzewia mesenterica]|uniref:Glycosyl hydrolase family 13 catalytic domain-containing protein n=1 Tax=Bondarzewia mesenterica TaxID=1095465 RepID=A0A4S4LWW3_9AGAM|nr:hypothetical protein EW146_g4401 [Bondarzewia mesenterica]